MADQKPVQPKLVSKLAEVMAAIDRVPKRGKNTFHNYDYAMEADIVAAIRTELSQRHIMLIPSTDGYEFRDLPPKKDGTARGHVLLLRMTMTFHDGETGESLSLPWMGAGEDSGDKSIYKAMTGAIKYALMKTFLIPTGDDPEADADKRERKQQRRETREPNGDRVNTSTGEVRPASTGAFINAGQQKELIEAGHKAGWTGKDFAAWLKSSGYQEWSKIPASAFGSVMSVMKGGTASEEGNHAA